LLLFLAPDSHLSQAIGFSEKRMKICKPKREGIIFGKITLKNSATSQMCGTKEFPNNAGEQW